MHSITKSKADVKLFKTKTKLYEPYPCEDRPFLPGDLWQPGTEQKAGMFEKYLNISHGNFKFSSFCFKQIERGV